MRYMTVNGCYQWYEGNLSGKASATTRCSTADSFV
ncbi:hypothetical protein SPAB_01777 [Salmonella enterica subsp. enterica serovar Paratyphi B str. SPB7]|uniref:Uncharacterized protein n=1 Tax=Salmonella paratyphi B (strain ATCC BAA-1250 / SPB7) TaxID=1016998 RepID=A0A6C6Z0P2_SALPB|nr:hypothetical protein SPAB_01777 [Salmonella enterica subsp. enterica serovar Paratyphi B str. SPB7]